MTRIITAAALASVLLYGCDATVPLKMDTRAIGEMPRDAALAYLKNWQPPANTGYAATMAAALGPKPDTTCGGLSAQSMVIKNGNAFPYTGLRLLAFTYTHSGRWKSVSFRLVESTFVGCEFKLLGWDIQNTAMDQRMTAEANRIATAFAALGVKIEQ